MQALSRLRHTSKTCTSSFLPCVCARALKSIPLISLRSLRCRVYLGRIFTLRLALVLNARLFFSVGELNGKLRCACVRFHFYGIENDSNWMWLRPTSPRIEHHSCVVQYTYESDRIHCTLSSNDNNNDNISKYMILKYVSTPHTNHVRMILRCAFEWFFSFVYNIFFSLPFRLWFCMFALRVWRLVSV